MVERAARLIKRGRATLDELATAADRYHAYVTARQQEIMQAEVFYGAAEKWASDWTIPAGSTSSPAQPAAPAWFHSQPDPDAAWEELNELIRNGYPNIFPTTNSPALARTIKRLHWGELCEMTRRDLHFMRRDFGRIYEEECRRPASSPVPFLAQREGA